MYLFFSLRFFFSISGCIVLGVGDRPTTVQPDSNRGCCDYIVWTTWPLEMQTLTSNFSLALSVCRDCLAAPGQREDLDLR